LEGVEEVVDPGLLIRVNGTVSEIFPPRFVYLVECDIGFVGVC